MKVLLLTPTPPDRHGSSAIPALLHAQLIGLEERHDVTVVTAAGPNPDEIDAAERLRRDGHEVQYVPRHVAAGAQRWKRRARMASTWAAGREPWRTTWYHEPALQPVLDRLLARGRYDVVSVEDNSMATYRVGTDVGRVLTEYEVRNPRALQLHVRGRAPREWPAHVWRELDWHRWPRYERDVWERFDVVQVFSRKDADSVVRVLPTLRDRVRVNPFAIDPPDVPDHAVEHPNTVAFIGHYSHPPNVDAARRLATEIFPRVLSAVPSAQLRLAGSEMPAAVRALAGPGVEVVGRVETGDAFLATASVVATPVHTGGGMRMKALHALALGRALVTTTRGAEGLLVGKDRRPFVIADNDEAFAAAVVALLRDDGARRALGARGRAFVEEHHSPSAYARRLEAVYAEAVARRAGRV
jgi:glycosyltransferase involved in cell wall biosynthesis